MDNTVIIYRSRFEQEMDEARMNLINNYPEAVLAVVGIVVLLVAWSFIRRMRFMLTVIRGWNILLRKLGL